LAGTEAAAAVLAGFAFVGAGAGLSGLASVAMRCGAGFAGFATGAGAGLTGFAAAIVAGFAGFFSGEVAGAAAFGLSLAEAAGV
jgi:hypothetical protein